LKHDIAFSLAAETNIGLILTTLKKLSAHACNHHKKMDEDNNLFSVPGWFSGSASFILASALVKLTSNLDVNWTCDEYLFQWNEEV